MFKELVFDRKKVYPTLVVSTVSSGKSTLINALVGKELLPNRNGACTAKAVAILDNDLKPQFEIHAVEKNGKYSLIEKATKADIKKFNQTNEVSEMILEGQIRGIKNSKKSLLIIDTPGINNSMDLSHEMVTMNVLDEFAEGLILYVINAQQIGTYDDSSFLRYVANKLKKNPKFKIIFVVNKMDLIDPEKEDPYELMENCKNYILEKGIENPVLIPISASSALSFKKVLNGEELLELEEENFYRNFKYFKNDSFSLVNYAVIAERGNLQEFIVVDGQEYSRGQIYAALANTGLALLEKVIDETMVNSLKMKAPKISCKREVDKKATSKKKKGKRHKKKR